MRSNYGVLELHLYKSGGYYVLPEKEEKALVKLVNDSDTYNTGNINKSLVLKVEFDSYYFVLKESMLTDDKLEIRFQYLKLGEISDNRLYGIVFGIGLNYDEVYTSVSDITIDEIDKEFTPAE